MAGSAGYAVLPVGLTDCEVLPGFWRTRLVTNRDVTVPHCLDQLDKTGRVANLERVAEGGGAFEGDYAFNDSDVYKTLEAVAYVLAARRDQALEARADRIIDAIARAQASDGYLFTRTMLEAPERRWTDMNSHEMYCGGHLFEAAVAYARATGKERLLDVARRLADHYLATFGPTGRHWVDGHEEVGLALVKLAEHTGERRYLDFAAWHLEERGRGHGQGRVWDMPGFGAAYSQDRVPVADLTEAEGHAVRAMYLFSAMADIAAQTPGHAYEATLERMWQSVVGRKMYVTGGIGAAGEIEGFGPDHHLPNATAYCETCAAIGMILWSMRMHRRRGEGRFADIIERELYNGVLAGVSLAGDRFFYANPLESDGSHHRSAWFGCACCPPNLARLVAQVPSLVYSVGGDTLYVNQLIASRVRADVGGASVVVRQESGLPWRGRSTLVFEGEAPMTLELALRVPAWARGFALAVNGEAVVPSSVSGGYARLRRVFRPGDTVGVRLPMPVEVGPDDPRVAANRGRVSVRRGPVVYCAEEIDQPGPWPSLAWPSGLAANAAWAPDLLGGVVALAGLDGGGVRVRAVPYFAWDNRAPGRMAVWLPDQAPRPRAPQDAGRVALGQTLFEREDESRGL